MPAALAATIRELRLRYRPEQASLPAEITLIGSSGVGALDPDQSADDVIASIGGVAESIPPLTVRFGGMATFPGSGVYFFPPLSRAPFDDLQARLLRAGLRCGPSPFPFTPHLTVARIHAPALASEILAVPAPEGEFLVDQLAVYSQVDFDTRLHYRIQLRGARD
jgi:2'-5' RNA ligase